MKKIILFASIFFLLLVPVLLAQDLLLEDFSDGNYNEKPSWWTFDAIQLQVTPVTADSPAVLGKFYLKISGTATNWYVGGFGSELSVDATLYDALQLDVLGNGSRSGRIKIEFYDDDNNNKDIESDENNNYAPIYDDRWIYEQRVDWHGWKTLTIPFSQFKDDNLGVGDDKWNPDQKNGSGGLMKIQYILVATSKTGAVDIGLDNIKLIKVPVQK